MSNNKSMSGNFFGGLLLGGMLGAITALLFAPKAGEETREQIQVKWGELRDSTEKKMEGVYTKANVMMDKMSERAEGIKSQGQAVIDEFQKQSTTLLKETKQSAKEAIDEIKNAAAESDGGGKSASKKS